MASRVHIPADLQRRVRSHCGFGCVICGEMPTQIEHIDDYSIVKRHDFENLVLLCLRHHGEVTARRLSKSRVKQGQLQPYSISKNISKYSPEFSRQLSLDFGSVSLISNFGMTFFPFSIFGKVPITVKVSDKILISMKLYDRHGNLAISMVENVLDFRPSALWDVRITGTSIRVSYGERFSVMKLRLEGSVLSFVGLRFAVERVPVVVDPNGIHFPVTRNALRNLKLDASAVDFMTFVSVGHSPDFSVSHSQNSLFLIGSEQACSDQGAWEIARKFRYRAD